MGGRILPQHLPAEVREAEGAAPELLSLEEVEKRHILRVLGHTRDYDEAATEYERFLELHPVHRWAPHAQFKLALSYDHRIVDGSEAVQFLVGIKKAIEDPARLLLDL